MKSFYKYYDHLNVSDSALVIHKQKHFLREIYHKYNILYAIIIVFFLDFSLLFYFISF